MKLSLPNVKHESFGKRTFLFAGAKIFNNLPLTVNNNNLLLVRRKYLCEYIQMRLTSYNKIINQI